MILFTSLLLNGIEEAGIKKMFNFLTLLQVLSIVTGSGDTFQRIDKNDESGMAIGFTMIFQECIFDFRCNFIVRRSKGSEFETMQNIDDGTKYYNVWKRLKKQGRQLVTLATYSNIFGTQILCV